MHQTIAHCRLKCTIPIKRDRSRQQEANNNFNFRYFIIAFQFIISQSIVCNAKNRFSARVTAHWSDYRMQKVENQTKAIDCMFKIYQLRSWSWTWIQLHIDVDNIKKNNRPHNAVRIERNECEKRRMRKNQAERYVEKNEFKSKVKLNELIMYGAMWSLIADRWQSPNVQFQFYLLKIRKLCESKLVHKTKLSVENYHFDQIFMRKSVSLAEPIQFKKFAVFDNKPTKSWANNESDQRFIAGVCRILWRNATIGSLTLNLLTLQMHNKQTGTHSTASYSTRYQ